MPRLVSFNNVCNLALGPAVLREIHIFHFLGRIKVTSSFSLLLSLKYISDYLQLNPNSTVLNLQLIMLKQQMDYKQQETLNTVYAKTKHKYHQLIKMQLALSSLYFFLMHMKLRIYLQIQINIFCRKLAEKLLGTLYHL